MRFSRRRPCGLVGKSLTTAIDFQNSFACVATAPSTANLRGTLILDQKVSDDFLVPNLHPIRAAVLE